MIKFFRKIRQNLLMENKTGKYFKYAIGEIILVVVGILIALQINNWNEGINKDELEKSYLITIKDNLNQDIEDFDKQIQNLKAQINDIDSIVRILNLENSSLNTLDEIILQNQNILMFREKENINNSGFLSIINSGSLNLFSKTVQNNLLELVQAQNHYSTSVQTNKLASNSILSALFMDLPFFLGSENTKVYFNNQLNEQILETVNWKVVRIKFVTALVQTRGRVSLAHRQSQIILAKTKELEELISSELERG